MKDEIKEIFNKYGKEKYNDEYCLEFETYIIELQELKKIYDYITNLQEENEKLKNGYCELKVKCNNGECDCTNEEYEGMVQANMRGILLLDDYKSRTDKALDKLYCYGEIFDSKILQEFQKEMENILKGEDE